MNDQLVEIRLLGFRFYVVTRKRYSQYNGKFYKV